MNKITLGFLFSLLLHAGLYGGVTAYMLYENHHPDSVDIDLSSSSLIRKVNNPGGRPPLNVAPPEPWILGSSRFAPQPKALSFTPKAVVDMESVPCPPPCPANANDWMPASAVSEKPVMPSDTITTEDYPREAIRKGRTATVTVIVLIDAQGHVRDVQVLNASDPEFSTLVETKLKACTFRPAYDQSGNAVPCRFKIPFKFDLI